MEPYERFAAWRHSHELFLQIREAVRHWPREERFELSSQTCRAAWPVAANIVEGSALRGSEQLGAYLDRSYGSLAEVGYALRTALESGYLTAETYQRLEMKRTEASKTLWGLMNSVRS